MWEGRVWARAAEVEGVFGGAGPVARTPSQQAPGGVLGTSSSCRTAERA